MHLELRHLRTVHAIHEQGGLARAAEVLKRRETLEGEELRRLLAGDPVPAGA